MLFRIFKLMKDFLLVSVSDRYKKEFEIDINMINITRGKITAITFITVEIVQLTASLIIKGDAFLKRPSIYYGVMYITMIIAMTLFLLMFIKLENNISKNSTSIAVVGAFFAIFILSWCSGISLLDQLSSGQIIVYAVAIISIAVAPIFKPVILLLIYFAANTLFFILLPCFQKSSGMLFADYINSSAFVVISWVISYMMYKNYVDNFNNRKIIQDKSDELRKVNEELEDANRKLEKLSQTDGLTGIFNRAAFDSSMKSEWDRCKRYSISLSLIMIDIDFFKLFNDNYGHQAGDECLRQVAEVFLTCARRSSDVVARYGGEEFAIILSHIDKQNVIKFAEQLREKVEQLAILHSHSPVSKYVTISLGVSTTIPSSESSIEEFIGIADKALYEAIVHA